jgi:nucleotide-binding universal stress UspA family protein
MRQIILKKHLSVIKNCNLVFPFFVLLRERFKFMSYLKLGTMKKILVPTDFSDHARNAGYYAVNLAKVLKAHLVLYHAYTVPAYISSPPVYSYNFVPESNAMDEVKQIERDNFSRLRFFRETILKGKNEPCCSVIQERTFVNDGIADYADEHHAELIIMGTRGSHHTGGDMLIAPATWGVIQKSKVPVLAIPHNYHYQKIRHICFATNLLESDIAIINTITRYASSLDARISIVHVNDNPGNNNKERAAFEKFQKDIEGMISNQNLEFVLLEHKDVSVALAEFIKNNQVDIISVSNEKRNVFMKLFHRSLTRMFVIHTDIPLLAFPSKFNTQ